MCRGVFFHYNDQDMRVYFPNHKALLPIEKKSGEIVLLPWGRRKEQAGKLPLGGWARLDSIYAGRWERYFPRAVKLPIHSFMESDIEGHSQWHDITNGKWIQGLVAREGHEQRVYVVTILPEQSDAIYDRWPRILNV